MAAYAVFVMIFVALSLPKQDVKQKPQAISALKRYSIVLRNKTAVRYLIVQSCGYSVMMVFVTNSSFIYQDHFGLAQQIFGLVFALNTVFNIIVNRFNSSFLNKVPAHKLLRVALSVQAFFVILLIIMTKMDVNVVVFAIGIIGAVGILGAIQPNTNALFMSQYTEHTGSASALLGACQFITASIMGGIATWLHNDTLWPVVLVMIVLVTVANFVLPKAVPEEEKEVIPSGG